MSVHYFFGIESTLSDSKEVNIYDFEIKEWIAIGLKQYEYAQGQSCIYFDKFNKKNI